MAKQQRSGSRQDRRRMGGGRRLTLAPLGLALCLLASALLLPAAASALQAHHFLGPPISGPGPEAGRLSLRPAEVGSASPGSSFTVIKAGGSGLAVDDTSHDVYVADTGNHRISEFEAGGGFVRAWGWGVATGASELESCSLTCEAGVAGSSPGQLDAPLFIAVDDDLSSPSHGDVYVADVGDDTITKYDGEGHLQSAWGTDGQMAAVFAEIDGIAVGPDGGLRVLGGNGQLREFDQAGAPTGGPFDLGGAHPGGLAVDGEGDIYALTGLEAIEKFDSAGHLFGRVIGSTIERQPKPPPVGLAADQSTNEFFASEISSIIAVSGRCQPHEEEGTRFLCTPFQTFDAGPGGLDEGAGVAVDSATGTVYAASAGNDEILAFPPAVEASTEPATDVTASTATLNGTVDAFGSALTTCRFEYGVGVAEGQSAVPCEGTQAANGKVAVEAKVSGLEGERTYSFRLRPTNANGDVKADEAQFPTLKSPGISEVLAKEVAATSATLTASIDPRGSLTHYRFEYGPCEGPCATSPYPGQTPEGSAGGGAVGVPVQARVSGLAAGTTYHFRVFAQNERGPVTSPEHTFVYLPGAPIQTGCGNDELRQLNGSTALPDCRAYELVTPARKNGSLIGAVLFGALHYAQIGPGGSSVTVPAIQCLPGTPSCVAHRGSEGEPYQMERTPGGWQTTPLAPSAARHRGGAFQRALAYERGGDLLCPTTRWNPSRTRAAGRRPRAISLQQRRLSGYRLDRRLFARRLRNVQAGMDLRRIERRCRR
jgi:DNA-binding beta-propeller fold protein YncE